MMGNNNEHFKIEDLVAPSGGMKRDMGLFKAIGLMAGLMIGSGIFYVGAFVLDYIQLSTGWALVAWVIAGLFSLCAGLCYAEMGTAMPKSGGSYIYLTAAYGPCLSFTMGWTDFWICQNGSIAALGLGVASYLCPLLGIEGIGVSLVAVAVVVVLSLINMMGVNEGSTVSTILLVLKLAVIAFIIGAGLFYSGGTGDGVSFAFAGGNFIGAISMAVVAALWAFDGWTSVCMVAEEIKEPQKNIPKAVAISLGGITLLYAVFNLVIMKILPAAQIASADNATFDAVEVMFGKGAAIFLTVGIILSILGSANSAILAYPREYYAMAKDKRFFPIFGKLNKKTGTPINSQIITMIYASIICFFADFQELVNIAVLATWIYYTLSVSAVFVLRKKYPNIERPYKVTGYPVMPALVIIFAIIMLAANFISDPKTVIGLLIPLSGLPAYFIFQWYFKKHPIKDFD